MQIQNIFNLKKYCTNFQCLRVLLDSNQLFMLKKKTEKKSETYTHSAPYRRSVALLGLMLRFHQADAHRAQGDAGHPEPYLQHRQNQQTPDDLPPGAHLRSGILPDRCAKTLHSMSSQINQTHKIQDKSADEHQLTWFLQNTPVERESVRKGALRDA